MRSRVFLLAALAIAACNADTFTGDDGGSDTGADVPPVGGDGGHADGESSDAKAEATAPLRYCQTIDAQFCADFDVPGDAGAGFVANTNDAGWSYDFETAQHVSQPEGLRVDFPGTPPGAAGLTALLSPQAQSTITADLDVLLPGGLPSSTQPLFAFQFGINPNPALAFGLAHESGWRLERGTGTPSVVLNPQPAEGSWVHVQLVVQLDPTAGVVSLLVDSTLSATLTGQATVPSPGNAFPAALTVGASCVGTPNGSGGSFFYDNAVIRVK